MLGGPTPTPPNRGQTGGCLQLLRPPPSVAPPDVLRGIAFSRKEAPHRPTPIRDTPTGTVSGIANLAKWNLTVWRWTSSKDMVVDGTYQCPMYLQSEWFSHTPGFPSHVDLHEGRSCGWNALTCSSFVAVKSMFTCHMRFFLKSLRFAG